MIKHDPKFYHTEFVALTPNEQRTFALEGLRNIAVEVGMLKEYEAYAAGIFPAHHHRLIVETWRRYA